MGYWVLMRMMVMGCGYEERHSDLAELLLPMENTDRHEDVSALSRGRQGEQWRKPLFK